MKTEKRIADKARYRQLRSLSCEALWREAVARFDQSTPQERIDHVAVIRAVGVAFSESGSAEQKIAARAWLVTLLHDPAEKVRRYAMAALPKLGAGPAEEAELLALLSTTSLNREKKFLGQSLDKIGGTATLEVADRLILPQTEQKVKARVARSRQPTAIRLHATIPQFDGLRIHLRCRKGLESIVRDEVQERFGPRRQFRLGTVSSGLVVLVPLAPFSLADVFTLRCFGALNLVLGAVRTAPAPEFIDALAAVITSPLARDVLTSLTEGPIRYRLDFMDKSHQRGAVRLLANRAYALCPDILNDARGAPWSVDIHPTGSGASIELRPRLSPDPRFAYRQDDVPAASHPPLAACMAKVAGRVQDEIVWDPFCGSGLELIESALLGGVQRLIGTDLSPTALAVAEANVTAATLRATPKRIAPSGERIVLRSEAGASPLRRVASAATPQESGSCNSPLPPTFACCDFRDYAKVPGLGPSSVTLIITNPPMGRRVRIPNMQGLFADLFSIAATVLKPGGRLVFANPLRLESPHPLLQLQSRQVIDLGGFDCRLEVYRKAPGGGPP